MDKDEIIRRAVEGVKRAKGYCDDIEFSPEDAARTEPDFLCRGRRGGHRRRGHDGQHSRHRRLRHAGPLRRRDQESGEPRAEHRQGRHQRPLPQRPGPGRGQQPGGRRERRGPGRVHHQRHRRAGRQLLARRSRHGPAHPQRLLPHRDADQHAAAVPDQPAGRQHHRHAGAAEQGDRRPATPSPTKPASTRTACSRNAPPTRSCGPKTSASRRPTWCWASTAAGPPWPTAAKALGYHLTGEQLQTVFDEFKKLADKKKEIYDADIAALIEQQIHDVAGPVDARFLQGHLRHRPGAGGDVTLRCGAATEESPKKSPAATARSTPSFLAIEKDHRRLGRLPRLPRPQRHRRQGRPGRSRPSKSSTTASSTAAAASRPTASRPARRPPRGA